MRTFNVKILILVLFAFGALGCNAILGIEDKPLDLTDDNSISCEGGACAACSADAPCPKGQRCSAGVCKPSTVTSSDGSVSDARVPDTGIDGGDLPDGGACQDGALRCDGVGQVARSLCVGGTWTSAEPCGDGQLCDSQALSPGECSAVLEECLGRTPDLGFCSGAQRIVCGPDLVTSMSETCSSAQHCIQSTGPSCAACVLGQAKCEGDSLWLCSDDRSGFKPNTECNAGECNAQLGRCTALLCDPNVYDCVNNDLVVCNQAGTANTTVKACGTGTCDKGNKRCNVCEPNQVLGCGADGNQQVCAPDGQSIISRSCASVDPTKTVCTGVGICVGCKPLSNTCQNSTTLVTCSGLGVASVSACSGTTCVVDQCTGECAPGELQCAGSASPARQQCGPTGAFSVAATCAGETLCDTASVPAGVCRGVVNGCVGKKPGDVVCDGSTRLVCGPDLVTATSKSCASAAYCQQGNGAECATCITNEHVCAGAQLRVCNATHTGFVDKQTCASAALCNKELGACTSATCEPNAWSCSGNALRHCNGSGTDYVASDAKTCGAGLCNAGAQRCNVCQPNQIRCLEEGGKGRVQCSADGGSESAITACANACLGGSCVACAPAAKACANAATLNTCDANGAWTITTNCSTQGTDGKTCIGSACTGQCAQGRVRCDASGNVQTCDGAGSWGQPVVCAGPSASGPGFLCDKPTGRCLANPEFPLGNSSPASGVDTGVSDGEILATAIKMPEDVMLRGIAMHGSSASVGGQVRYGLYTDIVVNGRHQPGSLLTHTQLLDPFFANSTNFADSNDAIALKKDVVYWVAAKTSEASSENVRVLSYNNVAAGDGTGTRVRAFTPWVGLPPASFPTFSYENGKEWGIFVIVQRYWH